MTVLLGPAEIRELGARLRVAPAKSLGQNFVHDPNTVRRIVRLAGLDPDEPVLEVGPGLGSLTLGLLDAGARVLAVEIDPVLAGALGATVAAHTTPARAAALRVVHADALTVPAATLGRPAALVANLPYNVAVPVLLRLLADLPSLRHGLVMVQREVADRLVAGPGSRTYGVPSVKLAWYAAARLAGRVPPSVFWPVPNVDSGLVAFERRDPPVVPDAGVPADRVATFAVIDAAFAQRRKTLRGALAGWAGSATVAAEVLRAAGVDPGTRGEALPVQRFAAIAAAGAAVRVGVLPQ